MELAKARYVNVYKLMEFANNMKDKTIDANDIARFPWADVRENVHAHWEDDGQCSNCKDYPLARYMRNPNFCPNCGAQMDEKTKPYTMLFRATARDHQRLKNFLEQTGINYALYEEQDLVERPAEEE